MYRKATSEDCIHIYNLICELEQKQLPLDKFTDIYNRKLNNDNYYYMVCERDGEVIAALTMRYEEQLHHAERIAEIVEFIVAPKRRDHGVGGEMFDRACEVAREAGCAQLEASSNQLRNDANRFYIRNGMHNFHYKFSMRLVDEDPSENAIGV